METKENRRFEWTIVVLIAFTLVALWYPVFGA